MLALHNSRLLCAISDELHTHLMWSSYGLQLLDFEQRLQTVSTLEVSKSADGRRGEEGGQKFV
jgi:hypothetical protein